MKTKEELIDALIDLAFAEDIGDGDHTTLSTIPADAWGVSIFWSKRKAFLPVSILPDVFSSATIRALR